VKRTVWALSVIGEMFEDERSAVRSIGDRCATFYQRTYHSGKTDRWQLVGDDRIADGLFSELWLDGFVRRCLTILFCKCQSFLTQFDEKPLYHRHNKIQSHINTHSWRFPGVSPNRTCHNKKVRCSLAVNAQIDFLRLFSGSTSREAQELIP
jgi:hypothetical protein